MHSPGFARFLNALGSNKSVVVIWILIDMKPINYHWPSRDTMDPLNNSTPYWLAAFEHEWFLGQPRVNFSNARRWACMRIGLVSFPTAILIPSIYLVGTKNPLFDSKWQFFCFRVQIVQTSESMANRFQWLPDMYHAGQNLESINHFFFFVLWLGSQSLDHLDLGIAVKIWMA